MKVEIDDEEELTCAPPDSTEVASVVTLHLLPPKSKERYEKAYKQFMYWCEQKQAANCTENVLLEYFAEKIQGYESSTLWSLYSMLKATLIAKKNIDISKYSKLIALLKQTTDGYRAKKSSTFSKDQIEKFLCDAPDEKYLLMKVCTIFGIVGACRRDELTRLTVDDIEDVGSALLVKIPNARNFTVFDKRIRNISLLEFYRKYVALRPSHTEHRRFFVFFNSLTQKCSTQVVGINTIGKIPTEIATFLELANPRSYTGHCFRRCSPSLLANPGTTIKRYGGWKKSSAGVKGNLQYSKQINQVLLKQIHIGEVGTSRNLIDDSNSSTNSMCSVESILNFQNDTSFEIHAKMSAKRVKTSYIWNFFTEKNNSDVIAICNICKQELCYKSSSSNLKKHIERKHPLVKLKDDMPIIKEEPRSRSRSPYQRSSTPTVTTEVKPSSSFFNTFSEEQVSTIVCTETQTESSSLKRKSGFTTKEKIDENLMLLFIRDFQPFSIVEDNGFKNFVNVLNPDYELPSKKSISNSMLQAVYEEAYQNTKEELKEVNAITLTTDFWVSKKTEHFLTITAHFITKDFQLKNVLLDCPSFGERPTINNLAHKLRMVFREWNIENKILIILSDNTINICKAIKEDLQLNYFCCYAHTINLIVKDALKQITKILDKVKKIITYVKRSSFATAILLDQQKSLKGEAHPKKLIQDVATRWNSTYYMIERFIYLEEPIRTTLTLLNKDLPTISPEEWQFLKETVRILKPMETLTNFISEQNYLAASSVIILTDGLRHTYENLTHQNFMPDAKKLMRSIISAINNRLGDLENNNMLTLATFLDPRYKEFGFTKSQVFETAKNNIISQITDLIIEKNIESKELELQQLNDINSTLEDISIWEQFEQRKNKFQPSETAESKAVIEVKRYLDEPPIPRSENPLNWWKMNAYNFPNLAEIVKNNIMSVATSVPCEELFSKSGQILSERKTRLSSSKIKKILFLNSYKDNAAMGLCNNTF